MKATPSSSIKSNNFLLTLLRTKQVFFLFQELNNKAYFGEALSMVETIKKSTSPTKFSGITASEDVLNTSPALCNQSAALECAALAL